VIVREVSRSLGDALLGALPGLPLGAELQLSPHELAVPVAHERRLLPGSDRSL